MDEKADKAANKVVNAPDSAANKVSRKIKEIIHQKKDSLRTNDVPQNDTLNTGHQIASLLRRQLLMKYYRGKLC
jgi:myo-inositol-1-phosphate synthase